ncbi:DUF5615 family PIN-like protein [Myxococcota bacterium]|nr:DUF5615 family PIN-like protein [Myxococcota bacterium]
MLVDEDSQARTLVARLRAAGHDVETAETAGLNSLADEEVLRRATAEGRVLLTRNCGDFRTLHALMHEHAGIVAVYQDADPAKNMSYAEIVAAIGGVEASLPGLAGEFVVLNAWK